MMWKHLLSFITAVTCLPIAQAAYAEVLFSPTCRQGHCFQSKFIRKVAAEESTTGTLYTVEIASRSWPMGTEPPSIWNSPGQSYVNCSKFQPAGIFKSSFGEEDVFVVHLLDPDTLTPALFMIGSYEVYGTTCHNLVGPFSFSESLNPISNATQSLGYNPFLRERQVTINSLDLLKPNPSSRVYQSRQGKFSFSYPLGYVIDISSIDKHSLVTTENSVTLYKASEHPPVGPIRAMDDDRSYISVYSDESSGQSLTEWIEGFSVGNRVILNNYRFVQFLEEIAVSYNTHGLGYNDNISFLNPGKNLKFTISAGYQLDFDSVREDVQEVISSFSFLTE